MKFESKAHMAQELMSGKHFKLGNKGVIYYDEKSVCPFRFEKSDIGSLWNLYDKDVWTEVVINHVHQDLIDSYKEGQAWQYMSDMGTCYCDCKDGDKWIEPDWAINRIYRLHPCNEFIQAYNNGVKIQVYSHNEWVDVLDPYWYEDNQYRIKPATKIVYEWMFKSKFEDKWMIEEVLLDEEKAKEHFKEHTYRKTGREFEVEV
jgi:hypothetical protein